MVTVGEHVGWRLSTYLLILPTPENLTRPSLGWHLRACNHVSYR